MKQTTIKPAVGKLGILVVGNGAVATIFMTGVLMARKGLAASAGCYGIQRFLNFYLKSPIHDYTQGEEAVNHLYQQYTMQKNAIREMGGYEPDEEID